MLDVTILKISEIDRMIKREKDNERRITLMGKRESLIRWENRIISNLGEVYDMRRGYFGDQYSVQKELPFL